MQFKPVPDPPADLDALEVVREAVPLVPKPEADCCARVIDRAGVPDRGSAEDWLTLLRALDLVDDHERGYARTREDPDREALAERFRERVLLAAAVHDALGEAPRDADAVFEAVREGVPRWERERTPDWESHHRDRVGRLLGWLALLGLAERVDGGYVRRGD